MQPTDVVSLRALPAMECACGSTRRAFAGDPGRAASVHLLDVEKPAERHYHKRMTEIYIILEGDGEIEIDGERVPVSPMSAVYIRPGCRHRAIGRLKLLNVAIPSFDPADEWFD